MAQGLAGLTLMTMAVAGCGHDGTVGATFPPTPQQIQNQVVGTVLMPGGLLSATDKWWRWAMDSHLLSAAYAVRNAFVQPIGSGGLVALSHVDPVDASDGQIDAPLLIAQTLTNGEGRYVITDTQAEQVDQCRLMVAIGGGEQLTRAFVTSHSTNTDESLDCISEATVRVILTRLTQAPPVQLCDFTTSGIETIYDAVSRAANNATGNTVFEINLDAYEKAVDNFFVKRAIDQATGVPVQP